MTAATRSIRRSSRPRSDSSLAKPSTPDWREPSTGTSPRRRGGGRSWTAATATGSSVSTGADLEADTATNPRLTVGMPVYNNARTIGRAVDTLLTQSYDAFRLFIADDG